MRWMFLFGDFWHVYASKVSISWSGVDELTLDWKRGEKKQNTRAAAACFNENIYIQQLLSGRKEAQLLCFPLQKGWSLIKIHND